MRTCVLVPHSLGKCTDEGRRADRYTCRCGWSGWRHHQRFLLMLSSQRNITVTCPSLFLAPNADLQAVEANFALKQMRDTDIFTFSQLLQAAVKLQPSSATTWVWVALKVLKFRFWKTIINWSEHGYSFWYLRLSCRQYVLYSGGQQFQFFYYFTSLFTWKQVCVIFKLTIHPCALM